LLAGKLQAAGFVIAALVIQPAEPQAPHQHFGVTPEVFVPAPASWLSMNYHI
jgi:hypothetical protein